MKIFNFFKNIKSMTKVSKETPKGFEETKSSLSSLNNQSLQIKNSSGRIELLQLSSQERMNLIKELLSLPKDLKGLEELIKTLAKNNLINLKDLKQLISQNSKQGLNKLILLNNINIQNGISQPKEIQEVMALFASIGVTSKTTPEVLKEIINIYVPITNPKEFEVQIESKDNKSKGNDKESYVSFLIESKNLGLFYIEIFKEENETICIIKTQEENKNLIENIKSKIENKAQINFIESKHETKTDYKDKLIFFQNNVADLNILNFMLNLIQQIYLQASRKTA